MRIAVVGSGISGMVAAYLLSEDHEIVMYEAADYVGGHTHTVDVTANGRNWPVDTGFIVFNEKTYPNFTRLMRRLGVGWQPSNMSFSVQCARTGLVFSPSSFNALFAQRRNLVRPGFWRMLYDALRFRRQAGEVIESDPHYRVTLAAYLEANGYSQAFRDHFIIPMGEAIWSADPGKFEAFPVRYLVEFFRNHGFLNIRDQPEWQVIKGGSRQYIEPLTRRFAKSIRLQTPVVRVERKDTHVTIRSADSRHDRFDQVVIATHSNQALQMLADPSDTEQAVLGAIPYQVNQAVLHTDDTILPRRRAAWASWNYHIPAAKQAQVAITYDMNILQGLNAPREFCVSLNLSNGVDPARQIKRMTYHHPVYTPDSLAARRRQTDLNGKRRTYYCGAYWGYGFHEDGVNSALNVARCFGKALDA